MFFAGYKKGVGLCSAALHVRFLLDGTVVVCSLAWKKLVLNWKMFKLSLKVWGMLRRVPDLI